MKIKMDFVTNSSSTSFVAWGITIESSELKEKYGEKIFKRHHLILEPELYNRDLNEFINGDFDYEVLDMIEKDTGLHARWMYDYDEMMIGMSPFKMKDDETLEAFKQRIVEAFHTAGLDDIKVEELGEIEECWMDN